MVKDWFKGHGAAELLNVFKKWDSFYEKIVLLAAWYESRGLHTPWKNADIVEVFKPSMRRRTARNLWWERSVRSPARRA